MFINISIPERKYSYVCFITMFINIRIPERKYSYVYFITMSINISIPERKFCFYSLVFLILQKCATRIILCAVRCHGCQSVDSMVFLRYIID